MTAKGNEKTVGTPDKICMLLTFFFFWVFVKAPIINFRKGEGVAG